MKKHLFGLFALVVAISAAAFTTVTKSTVPATSKLFRYNAPGGSFSQANVENHANWTYITSTQGCNGVNQKACEMLVPVAFVNSDNTLSSSLPISTLQSSPNTFYVNEADESIITNKGN